MVITNKLKFMMSAKRWRTVFVIKDIWVRNALRMAAIELGVEFYQLKENDKGFMYFFVKDVEGKSGEEKKARFFELLRRFSKSEDYKVVYFKSKINGVRANFITDQI